LMTLGWRSACEFANDQRMSHYEVMFKQVKQRVVALSEVIDPYRSVDENTFHRWLSSRRLGMSCMSGIAAPRAASRFAARTRIKVLMASRKRSALSIVGSATSNARSYRLSSIVTVVLMGISVHRI